MMDLPELIILDVGHGGCSVLRDTDQTVIIDCAPGSTLIDLLEKLNIHEIATILISHADSDHIAGMPAILRNFRPREMWIGVAPVNEDFRNLLAQAREQGIRIEPRFAGDEFDFGDAHIRIYAPVRGQHVGQARNNDSLVFSMSYRNSAVMLEGDAEKQVERHVAEQRPVRVDLLKIAHHGGATSTIPELLSAMRPKFAVISVGARNTFGHPRMETLERLSGANVKTYRTDLDGAVSFYLSGDGVSEATVPR